jgi:ABC-type glycerol-3-phosphate transport system permease component
MATASLAAPRVTAHPRPLRTVWQVIVVAFMLFWAIGPVAWMLLTSVKPDLIVAASPPVWVFVPTIVNYLVLFNSADFQPSCRRSSTTWCCSTRRTSSGIWSTR